MYTFLYNKIVNAIKETQFLIFRIFPYEFKNSLQI